MPFYPMLCEPHEPDEISQLNGRYVFERKYDGIRAILAVTDGKVTIHNRNAVDITHRYPDLVKQMEAWDAQFGPYKLVLDGEILVWDGNACEWSFPLVHSRDAQSDPVRIAALATAHPATFVAFDVLYDSADLRKLSFETRQQHLHGLASGTYRFETTADEFPNIPQDGDLALDLAIEQGWEGIVAKRLDSPYTSGRNSAWKKIKPVKTGSFIVMKLEPGNGSRADTFGAVHIGVKTPDGFEAVGKVGSGFTEATLRTIVEKWNAFEKGLTPPPVIEVIYQEVTEGGRLRFPRFKTIRTDVEVDDCTKERQLT